MRLREAYAVPGAARRLSRARLAIHRDQPPDVGPRDLRAEEDRVDEARGSPRRADALGAHLERRMRTLAGRQAETRRGQLRVGALERDLVAAPEPLHHGQRLFELGNPILASETHRLELALPIADRHADVEPTVRDVIQRGHALGHVHGVQGGGEHRGS
jgi:hypothetical protein